MCFFKFIIPPYFPFTNYLICIRTGLDVREFGKFQKKRRENNNVILHIQNSKMSTNSVEILKKTI